VSVSAVLFVVGVLVLFVSYAGYALWVALLSRLRPVPVAADYRSDPELPPLTCVMAAANEAALVGRKIEILTRQDYPADKLAIIVVSDASTDDTDRIVEEWSARDPRIRLLRNPERGGKPTALNLARRHIDTEIAVLMDVRQGLTDRALRELVAHLADPRVGLVSGDLRVAGDAYWRYEGYVRKCESRSGSMVQVTGSLYAIRTADLPEIPPETLLDDVYVPLKVARNGRRIVLAEKAGSLDVVTRSVGSEFVRKVRTLAGLVQVCHLVPGSLRPGRSGIAARFVLHKLLRLTCPYALIAVTAGGLTAGGPLGALTLGGVLVAALLVAADSLGARSRPASFCRSFLAMNLAALCAVPFYYLGWVSVTWTRVEIDRT
jgi:biofilm PGA synthesis N-glycosyltransferase PgaC